MNHLDQSLTVGLHILFAAIFVGGNVFLEFLLARRLGVIPPGQAARLGDAIGTDFTWLSWGSIIGLGVTGGIMLNQQDHLNVFDGDFLSTGYGVAVLTMVLIWISLVITGAVITFYFRPLEIKLPVAATHEDVDEARERSIQTAGWLRHVSRYNVIASSVAIIVGGFIDRGGF